MSEIKNDDINNILFKISKEIILPKYQKLNTKILNQKIMVI